MKLLINTVIGILVFDLILAVLIIRAAYKK